MNGTPRRPTASQWLPVLAIAALFAVGGWAVARHPLHPDSVQVGRRAPDFKVARLGTGDSVGVRSSYAGHVTLINIWATTCVPCRTEMPAMERLYQADKERGFRVAAVSIDDFPPTMVLGFTQSLGLSFDILQDRSGNIQQAFQTIGIPQSVLIDRSGRVAYTRLGPEPWDSPESRARIDRLLAERN